MMKYAPTTGRDDEERIFDRLITFEAVHIAFIDKEKIYTKSYDFAIGSRIRPSPSIRYFYIQSFNPVFLVLIPA